MTDRTLIESILKSPRRREAVQQLVAMLLEREQMGRPNARYEIVIVGRQVSSAVYAHCYSATVATMTDMANGAERVAR